MTVSHTSDRAERPHRLLGASAADYITLRFDSKCNRTGEPSRRSPVEWQAGAWRPPKSSPLLPASPRVGISLTPSGSRGFAVRRDGRGRRGGRRSWSHVRDPMLANSTTPRSQHPVVRGGSAR